MIPENHNHVVHIPVHRQLGFLNWDDSTQALRAVIDWLDQQTNYLPGRYSYLVTVNGHRSVIHVWFLEEHDALMCALRWSQGVDV